MAVVVTGAQMYLGLKLNEWVSIVTSIVGIVIIPFTLLGIWRSRVNSSEADNWKSRQEEIGTYNEINIRYIEFLRFLLQNPDVDIGEFQTPKPLTSDVDKYKRNIMYAMLVALMERAFLLYTEIEKYESKMRSYRRNRRWIVRQIDKLEHLLFGSPPPAYESHIFKTQWPGWEKYFSYYCSHEAFREYWNLTVNGELPSETPSQWHDTLFEKYINDLIKKEEKAQARSPRSPSDVAGSHH